MLMMNIPPSLFFLQRECPYFILFTAALFSPRGGGLQSHRRCLRLLLRLASFPKLRPLHCFTDPLSPTVSSPSFRLRQWYIHTSGPIRPMSSDAEDATPSRATPKGGNSDPPPPRSSHATLRRAVFWATYGSCRNSWPSPSPAAPQLERKKNWGGLQPPLPIVLRFFPFPSATDLAASPALCSLEFASVSGRRRKE